MKKDEKHFLGKNSYTRYNVHAILGTMSAENNKKALIRGRQLYYIQRQGFSDVVLGTSYLDIYRSLSIFLYKLDVINFRRSCFLNHE